MTDYPARPLKRCPTHPGELLAEILPATGQKKGDIAKMLGISRQYLSDITAGRKPVSLRVAAALGKMFGDGAAVWLKMQADYDAWQAEHNIDVSQVPTLRNVA